MFLNYANSDDIFGQINVNRLIITQYGSTVYIGMALVWPAL